MSEFDEGRLVQLAVDWIQSSSRNPGAAQAKILPETDLLQAGILDSLGLIDLVAFLEKTTDRQLDLLQLDEGDFTTLGGLCRAVVKAEKSGDGNHE